MNVIKEGWAWTFGSRKWHYVINNESLCGKWLFPGNPMLEQDGDDSPDNCAECRRRRKKKKGEKV